MDPTVEYLWAAGYDLPPDSFWLGGKPVELTPSIAKPPEPAPRRGKKAARAKREKATT